MVSTQQLSVYLQEWVEYGCTRLTVLNGRVWCTIPLRYRLGTILNSSYSQVYHDEKVDLRGSEKEYKEIMVYLYYVPAKEDIEIHNIGLQSICHLNILRYELSQLYS
jgi:hypothetical protein